MDSQGKAKVALTFALYQGDSLVRRDTIVQDIVKVGKDPRSHLRVDDELRVAYARRDRGRLSRATSRSSTSGTSRGRWSTASASTSARSGRAIRSRSARPSFSSRTPKPPRRPAPLPPVVVQSGAAASPRTERRSSPRRFRSRRPPRIRSRRRPCLPLHRAGARSPLRRPRRQLPIRSPLPPPPGAANPFVAQAVPGPPAHGCRPLCRWISIPASRSPTR